jgi:hypothetical protein
MPLDILKVHGDQQSGGGAPIIQFKQHLLTLRQGQGLTSLQMMDSQGGGAEVVA